MIATRTILPDEKLQERVAPPDPVTVDGDTVHEVLLVPRLTKPVNPLRAVIVMVELPGAPAATLTVVGLAAMVKSVTVTTTVAVWENGPLVPVIVMVYVPFTVGLKVRIEVAVAALVNVTVAGLSENVSPDGEEVPERLTVPVKP